MTAVAWPRPSPPGVVRPRQRRLGGRPTPGGRAGVAQPRRPLVDGAGPLPAALAGHALLKKKFFFLFFWGTVSIWMKNGSFKYENMSWTKMVHRQALGLPPVAFCLEMVIQSLLVGFIMWHKYRDVCGRNEEWIWKGGIYVYSWCFLESILCNLNVVVWHSHVDPYLKKSKEKVRNVS